MIRTITPQAARLLATADALRAMEQSDYDGVSYECSEAFDDHRFEGLGDVILLSPGVEISEDIVQAYDVAYRETWQRGSCPRSAGFGPRSLRVSGVSLGAESLSRLPAFEAQPRARDETLHVVRAAQFFSRASAL